MSANRYNNILIVRTDRIGDVILTTPAIAALRSRYPKSRISLLVSSDTLGLVYGNPRLNEIVVDDRKKFHKGLFGFIRLARTLRAKKYDLAIIYHTKKRTNLLCFLAGIPSRIGYKNDKFGFLLTKPIEDTRADGTKHEAEYCIDLLNHIGVNGGDLKLYVAIRQSSEIWVQQFFAKYQVDRTKKIVAIHPGASCISKRWPASNFSEVIKEIQDEYSANIIIIGGSETHKISKEIKSSLNDSVIDATGETSLSQLTSLLKRCDLLISNDSGPVHVACAVGSSVISIFGRNQAGLSPKRWRPIGKNTVVLHKEVGCKTCLAHNCKIKFLCLEKITVSEVFDAANSLLNSDNFLP